MNSKERITIKEAIALLNKNEMSYSPNLADCLVKEFSNKILAVKILRRLLRNEYIDSRGFE